MSDRPYAAVRFHQVVPISTISESKKDDVCRELSVSMRALDRLRPGCTTPKVSRTRGVAEADRAWYRHPVIQRKKKLRVRRAGPVYWRLFYGRGLTDQRHAGIRLDTRDSQSLGAASDVMAF